MARVDQPGTDAHKENAVLFVLGTELRIRRVHCRLADRIRRSGGNIKAGDEVDVRHSRRDGDHFLSVAFLDQRQERREQVDVAQHVDPEGF